MNRIFDGELDFIYWRVGDYEQIVVLAPALVEFQVHPKGIIKAHFGIPLPELVVRILRLIDRAEAQQ